MGKKIKNRRTARKGKAFQCASASSKERAVEKWVRGGTSDTRVPSLLGLPLLLSAPTPAPQLPPLSAATETFI